MIKFCAYILLLTGLLVGGVYIGSVLDQFAAPSFTLATLILLAFGTALIYRFVVNAAKPEFFVSQYLITIVVKLLGYAMYNLFMILYDRPGAAANVIFFMLSYFLFTLLEIIFLYRRTSRGNTP